MKIKIANACWLPSDVWLTDVAMESLETFGDISERSEQSAYIYYMLIKIIDIVPYHERNECVWRYVLDNIQICYESTWLISIKIKIEEIM